MTDTENQPQGLERVSSGIAGLDSILHGGFFKGGTYLIQGPPGAGKTILSNQLCFHHVAAGGQAVYISLLTETTSRLLAHLQSLAFFTPDPIADSLYYLSGYAVLQREGLEGLMALIRNEVRSRRASMLIIDGAGTAGQAEPDPRSWQQFLHDLHVASEILGCTSVLLMQMDKDDPLGPEQRMVDGVIELTSRLVDMRAVRELQVCKFRGSGFLAGRHPFAITSSGLVVYPRTEAILSAAQKEQSSVPITIEPLIRKQVGVERLDEMLHGGLPSGTTTLLLGGMGTGKTLLGCHFLCEGARQGEAGLYFGFYETPAQLLRKTTNLGMDMGTYVNNGQLTVLWQPPIEDILDVLGERLLNTIRSQGVRRLFLDGLSGFQRTVASTERLDLFLTTLFTTLRAMGVTSICAVELTDLISPLVRTPSAISRTTALVENVLFLRQVELHSHLYRLISIMNMRESGYDSAIREFRITDQGLEVASTFASAEAILTGIGHPAGTNNLVIPRLFEEEDSSTQRQVP